MKRFFYSCGWHFQPRCDPCGVASATFLGCYFAAISRNVEVSLQHNRCYSSSRWTTLKCTEQKSTNCFFSLLFLWINIKNSQVYKLKIFIFVEISASRLIYEEKIAHCWNLQANTVLTLRLCYAFIYFATSCQPFV